MRFLVDTHLLVWTATAPDSLSSAARSLIELADNRLYYSLVSLWEVAIKFSLGKATFTLDAADLKRQLSANGFTEVPITSEHIFTVGHLPLIHKDPSDRLIVAQAIVEGLTLLTSDHLLSTYPGPIRKV